MRGCGPHCGVCCHSVGADGDSLNIGRGSRHLVRGHSTGATCGTSDRAEQVAACAICGSRNTSAVLVADSHARLNRVGGSLAAVRWVKGSTGEVLATVDGVDGTARVCVVPVAVGRAQRLSWRGDDGGRRRRNSSAATIGWWKVSRRAWRRGTTTVGRGRVVGRCRARRQGGRD